MRSCTSRLHICRFTARRWTSSRTSSRRSGLLLLHTPDLDTLPLCHLLYFLALSLDGVGPIHTLKACLNKAACNATSDLCPPSACTALQFFVQVRSGAGFMGQTQPCLPVHQTRADTACVVASHGGPWRVSGQQSGCSALACTLFVLVKLNGMDDSAAR